MNGLDDKAGIQIHENDTAKGVDDECELLEEPNDLIVGLAHDDAQREESHVSGAKMASFKLSPPLSHRRNPRLSRPLSHR